jgi:hypothetical protein
MSKVNDPTAAEGPGDDREIIFDPAGRTGWSSEMPASGKAGDPIDAALAPKLPVEESSSPVFKELASAELPPLERENRGRLLMQSPNRLYFYWSLKRDPRHTLERLFGTGSAESYTLVIKLINLTRDEEFLSRAEAEGSWWFEVDSNSRYRAEIGLYAPNRPYIRLLYSNTVTTPRKKPSPRAAAESDWTVTAARFARVLNASGFMQDAFDVAIAGDDPLEDQAVTLKAFAELINIPATDFSGIASDELRHALFLIASGLVLEHLRWRIDASLFAVLQRHSARLNAEDALKLLREQYGIEGVELDTEDEGSATFAGSLVNMPRRPRKLRASKLSPTSSFGAR